jgi:hypothetical protein
LEGLDHRPGEGVTDDHEEVHRFVGGQREQPGRVQPGLGRDDDRAASVERAEGHPMGSSMHEGACGQASGAAVDRVLREVLGALDGRSARVATTKRAKEDVVLAPHHPLGHASGPARVQDVEVVG